MSGRSASCIVLPSCHLILLLVLLFTFAFFSFHYALSVQGRGSIVFRKYQQEPGVNV